MRVDARWVYYSFGCDVVERLLQQEREAEGDEFADKGKLVTGAYKVK